MASEGPNYCDILSQGVSGTYSWSNPTYAGADDALVASLTVSIGSTSRALIFRDFDFAIPSGATIEGIAVELEGVVIGQGAPDPQILLSTDGANWIGVPWYVSAFNGWNQYGDSTDMWGTSLTDTDINQLDFGFIIYTGVDSFDDIYWEIDGSRMTIWYSTGPPPQMAYPDADTDAASWTATPLWSKVDEPDTPSDADLITTTAT